MVRTLCVAGAAAWLWFGTVAVAHHSVAVNFDNSKTVSLTGTIKQLEFRNPHSRITLTVRQPDGALEEWLLEWSDRNALVRRKIPFELLHVGDVVTINASPHRSLDNLAYFRTAVLPDKSVLRDCGFGAFRQAIANGETVECEPERPR